MKIRLIAATATGMALLALCLSMLASSDACAQGICPPIPVCYSHAACGPTCICISNQCESIGN